jgi:tRNA(Ile)-lysidine synthetase-like protein
MIESIFKPYRLLNADNKIGVAVSGGSDSMAVLHLLSLFPKNEIHVFHVNHGTGEFADKASNLVEEYVAGRKRCHYHKMTITEQKPSNESKEEFWRNQRLKFFKSFSDINILTGHTLDDCVENWLMTACHGNPRLIPVNHANIWRPFMVNTKQQLRDFCIKHGVPFIDDPSNESRDYMRNVVRHDMIPHALKVNPGLYTVIKKKLLE